MSAKARGNQLMSSIIVRGIVNEAGELIVTFPQGLPPGPVEVEIHLPETVGISSQEILESDFVGMWEDRADLGDSVEYARKLRSQATRRKDK
jgi:hypothetical protein